MEKNISKVKNLNSSVLFSFRRASTQVSFTELTIRMCFITEETFIYYRALKYTILFNFRHNPSYIIYLNLLNER